MITEITGLQKLQDYRSYGITEIIRIREVTGLHKLQGCRNYRTTEVPGIHKLRGYRSCGVIGGTREGKILG